MNKLRLVKSLLIISALIMVGSAQDWKSLNETIAFEDTLIDAQDLAFILATHGFDVTPHGGYVSLQLNGSFKLTPNGNSPGLCGVQAVA